MPDVTVSRMRGKHERIQAHRKGDAHYVVYNPTSGSAYDVFKSPGGVWYCTCPFAQKGNHVRSGNNCKHLQRVLDKESGCGIGLCRDGNLCASCKFDQQMHTNTIKQ